MYGHEKEYHNIQLSVLRTLLAELSAKYSDALYAQSEGVYEITIRSQSKTISIPIDGMDASQLVIEEISRRLSKTERDLLWHTTEQGNESAEILKEEACLVQLRAAEAAQHRAEWEARQPVLAQQAAATPVQQPAPRKVGRPKKAVAVELAGQAALVPMNGAGGKQPGGVVSQPTM